MLPELMNCATCVIFLTYCNTGPFIYSWISDSSYSSTVQLDNTPRIEWIPRIFRENGFTCFLHPKTHFK